MTGLLTRAARWVYCQVLNSHRWQYTESYPSLAGLERVDKVCADCGHREVAFTGPPWRELADLGLEPPQSDVDIERRTTNLGDVHARNPDMEAVLDDAETVLADDT